MSQNLPSRTMQYEKQANGLAVRCQLKVFPDGSVYVSGDDIEAIFEFSPDTVENAIKFVESKGYVRVSS